MSDEKVKKTRGFKPLLKAFWALSRPRQEAFLKQLYEMSNENKDLFKMRLGDDQAAILTALKKDIAKETTNRIGRFRKLRLSKINQILRNADKYAFPMHQQIELKKEVWTGMLMFVIAQGYCPDRYRIATARHLDEYLVMVKHHILEKSEVEDVLKEDQAMLTKLFEQGIYVPQVADVYMKHFD